MSEFWNALRLGQEAREYWNQRDVRRAEREAREAQIGAVRERYGDTSGGDPATALAFRGDDRTQTEFDAERMRNAALAAMTAFRGMVGRADEAGVDPEQQRTLRGEAFDRIAGVLPSLGVDASQIGAFREMLIDDPRRADNIIEALRSSGGETASYAPRAVIDPETGRAVFVRAGEEVGRESADHALSMGRLEQGDERLGLSRERFQHDVETDSPEYIRRREAAEAEGGAVGDIAAALPRLNEVTDTAIARINELVENPNLDAIFGLPNLSRLDTGGFGAAGVVPGTPAADALALLNRTVGDVQTAAYESLRGGGQITEAERVAISQGIANLDRAQSPQQAIEALRSLAGVLDGRRNAAVEAAQAGLTGRSNAEGGGSTRRPSPAPSAAPSPSGGGIRREGEDVDGLLNRLGL